MKYFFFRRTYSAGKEDILAAHPLQLRSLCSLSSLLTMSTVTTRDGYIVRESEDSGLEKAFKIFGSIFAFLCVLVALRLLVNFCIDTAILRDSYPLWQALSKIRRFFCPWISPRTQPEGGASTEAGSSPTGPNDIELVTMDRLLAGMTVAQKEACIASILPSKVRKEYTQLKLPLVTFPLN